MDPALVNPQGDRTSQLIVHSKSSARWGSVDPALDGLVSELEAHLGIDDLLLTAEMGR
jgi:cobyric acid synthase